MLFRELQRMTVSLIQERIKVGDTGVTADGITVFRLTIPNYDDSQSKRRKIVSNQVDSQSSRMVPSRWQPVGSDEKGVNGVRYRIGV